MTWETWGRSRLPRVVGPAFSQLAVAPWQQAAASRLPTAARNTCEAGRERAGVELEQQVAEGGACDGHLCLEEILVLW